MYPSPHASRGSGIAYAPNQQTFRQKFVRNSLLSSRFFDPSDRDSTGTPSSRLRLLWQNTTEEDFYGIDELTQMQVSVRSQPLLHSFGRAVALYGVHIFS